MERVDVTILGRDYSLACLPHQKESLLAAVRLVDQRMLSVQGAGKIAGNERIAVMAAIQIAGEMLALKAPEGPLGNVSVGEFRQRIDHLNGLLDQVLPSGSA